MKKFIIGLLIVCLFWSTIYAQDQSAGWFANQTTVAFSKKWGLLSGVNIRSNDKWEHLQLIGMRAAISYNIRQNISLAAGLEHNYSRKVVGTVSGYFNDEVIWQHLLVTHHVQALTIINRLRMEERFLSRLWVQNDELQKLGSNFAERLRYLLRISYPLSGKKVFKKGGYLAVQDEVMFNLGDKSAVNGRLFDQNRIYAGVGYRFSPEFDAEIGYLRQYILPASGNLFINNVVQLGTFLRL
jgi:hypothetical protein